MSRLILAFCLLGLSHSAWAQEPDDWRYARERAQEEARQVRDRAREEAREARERLRDAQREAREAAREASREVRQAARDARREYWEERVGNNRGVHLRLLRSYTLPAGSIATEPIVVVGGSATIDGRAEDDVVVIGGTLRVGPEAVIRGEAVTVGGRLIADPRATIDGGVDETVVVWPDVDWSGMPSGWWAAASFGAMLFRLGLVLFVSLVITWAAPGWTSSIGSRLSEAPGSSLFLGLTSQLLFVPALVLLCIVLVISIVGIPLLLALPFVLVFAGVAWAAGFAGVVGRIGARLRGLPPGTSTSPTLDLLVGFVAITAVTVIGRILGFAAWPVSLPFVAAGWVIEWIVWTLGLGAMLTSFLGRRAGAPPAIPIIPRAAPSEM